MLLMLWRMVSMVKQRVPSCQISTCRHMPKRNESTPTQKLSTGVHSSIVPDNQKVKTTQYTYNEIITIERNEVLTLPTVCMNLEYTCLRKEVSHKDHILHDYIYKKKSRASLGGSDGKASACSMGYLGSIPGLGRSPGKGHGNPVHYCCLENPHGQRSLADYSRWGHRVRDDWTVKRDTE